jgi:hypothetical protein
LTPGFPEGRRTGRNQSASFNLPTRLNSSRLFVTSVNPLACAWLAMSVPCAPIGNAGSPGKASAAGPWPRAVGTRDAEAVIVPRVDHHVGRGRHE